MQKEDITIIRMTFVNAFLVKVKEGFVIVDTGLPMFWEKLENEMMAAGCLSAAKPNSSIVPFSTTE